MLNVGVIGYGYVAKTFHIPLIDATPEMTLSAVSSSQESVEPHRGRDFIHCKAPAELIQLPLDLVVITSPNDSHFTLAKDCLEAGKSVLLEKPMVTTTAEAETLVRLAKQHGKALTIFHNRRFDGDFLTVVELVRSGQLGEIHSFESRFDRWRPKVRDRWREQAGVGTGTWFDLGAHLLDQALVLFGLPEAITARCLNQRPGAKTVDYFHCLLHYKGLEVILHSSSFTAQNPSLRFRIEGSDASYLKSGLDCQEAQLQANIQPDAEAFGREETEAWGQIFRPDDVQVIETQRGGYRLFYRQLADALLKGEPVPVCPSTVVPVIQLLNLAEQSSQQGKTLPLD